MFSLFIATFAMSEIFAFLFCTTKIGEISDMAKCFENFVSQALGFLTSFYAAELRQYIKNTGNEPNKLFVLSKSTY